jgi:hypothetical protein
MNKENILIIFDGGLIKYSELSHFKIESFFCEIEKSTYCTIEFFRKGDEREYYRKLGWMYIYLDENSIINFFKESVINNIEIIDFIKLKKIRRNNEERNN